MRERLTDTAVAAGVAAVLATVVSADQGGRAGATAYLWAAGLGALMFWRRRHALLVLVLTVLGLFAWRLNVNHRWHPLVLINAWKRRRFVQPSATAAAPAPAKVETK